MKIKGLDLFRQILIESGKGIRPNEVQFPYNNLKKYLESRGFNHLLEYIKWGPSDVTNSDGGFKDPNDQNNDKVSKEGQRSKTVINRAKIRIAFYLPENTINIIRNEAHIRLASSMWYAAKYTLNLSYFAVLFVIICMAFNLKMPYGLKPFILFCAFIILMLGYYFGRKAKSEMDNNNFEEELPQKKSEVEKLAQRKSQIINKYLKLHDRAPFISSSFLVLSIYAIYYLVNQKMIECPGIIILYAAVISFLTIGALFAKHRIEETIHYQRVREILYVLETGYLARIFDDKNLPDPFKKSEA
ncbi:hypothetical protein [Desulfobacula sp.]|uniref:Uncharacterized protein n=1 Tax=Candidatus Desulfatibia vada TaxID=2841696 RepID=A0A8J6P923_9BACT|nr:hypothetical protein [Candidatus Desulfatibia vada]MBL6996526.1 hypothetical protein [Desulfobacula sp.]